MDEIRELRIEVALYLRVEKSTILLALTYKRPKAEHRKIRRKTALKKCEALQKRAEQLGNDDKDVLNGTPAIVIASLDRPIPEFPPSRPN